MLSIDIFDTLIIRLCEKPSDLFLHIGKRFNNLNSRIQPISSTKFSHLRNNAGILLNNSCKAEKINTFSIGDIYRSIPTFKNSISVLKDLELDVECDYCFISPEVENLIIEATNLSIPVILTSDIYFSKNQLKKILLSNNFDLNLISNFYVSCDYKCNKSSGHLFQKILKDFHSLHPNDILHLGDNFDSDILVPQSYGIKTYHFNAVPELLKEVCEYDKANCVLPNTLYSLRKIALHATKNPFDVESIIGSSVIGPGFTLFCDWILNVCLEDRKDNIYIYMREAEFFEPLIKTAALRRNININIKSLYVSRESTWLASLINWNEESCDFLFSQYGMTVGDIFHTLNLSYPSLLDNNISNTKLKNLKSDTFSFIRSYLLSDDIKKKIDIEINRRFLLIVGYLKQEAKLLKDSVTVDLGFRGSISSNLENICSKCGIKSSATHLLAIASEDILNLNLKGIDIRGFFASHDFNQDLRKTIHRSLMPIEQLLLGKVGSTKEYIFDGKKYIPHLHRVRIPRSEFKIKDKVRESALIFQKYFYDVINSNKIKRDILFDPKIRDSAFKMIHRLVDCPTSDEANLLGNLHHEINGGSDQIRKICSNEDQIILENSSSEEEFFKISSFHGVHWPQGVITISKPYFLLKKKLSDKPIDSYLQSMNFLIESVKKSNISSIMIYGAGEAGKSLLKAAKINEIQVKCFVDQKKSIWGSFIEGIEIHSINDALAHYENVSFVVGSFEFSNQIYNFIKSTLNDLNLENKIFKL